MNQQMNMAGMNATTAPAGGTPMMNNGGPRGEPISNRQQLNTYIYDYFLKNQHWELARAVQRELPINSTSQTKTSPSGRDVNGVDDSMDTDSKDDVNKRPSDLPVPSILDHTEGSFLFDWWCQFWDIWSAHRRKIPPGATASQYLAHAQQTSRYRQEAQRRMLQDQGMMPQYRNMMQGIQQNGMMVPSDLQKRAMANNSRNANPQLQQIKNIQQQHMMQNNMQRDGSGMEMGGQRPQSPSDSAPSPKRQRLEGNAFNGQSMGPAGRGQPPNMQQVGSAPGPGGNPSQLLLQNGLNPGQMPPNQFDAFQASTPHVQAKSLEGVNPGGMPQGGPMGQQGSDAQMEFFNNNPSAQMRGMPGGPGQQAGGTHALQDYQMQLMLLEQQNKKRLLMARQEQDNMTHGAPGSASMAQAGFAPTMSPQGSRAGGPSPNPNDQMKRGTPKMGQSGLPPSPLPDQSRGSPAPNFDPSQMPPGSLPPNFYPQMAGNAAMMRPPSSHPGFPSQMSPAQMEALARQNGGRMPNGIWQPGAQPMMQQGQGQQPAHMGTPQQRNTAMPPPPAPPAGVEPGRTQPPSPSQQPAQPPTPSQTAKPPPKTKKETKENRKKPPKKGAATTGATPASEPEPPTPTPSTPITPMHPSSFNNQKNGTSQPNNVQPSGPAPVSAPAVAPPPQMDANSAAPFAGLEPTDNGQFGLDFAGLDSQDVLENFDFDSFLHTDDNPGAAHWDSLMNFGNTDGVEAGTGDV